MDAPAFWSLWLQHAPRLFRLCLRELDGNRADAEDALNQAMLKALDALPSRVSEIVSIEAWLYRITANVCKDVHRDRMRSMRALAQFRLLQRADTAAEERPDGEIDPEHLLRRLPARLRNVMVMRVLRRKSYAEIAAALELTSATARKRVQQARELLRGWREREEFTNRASARL